MSASGVSSVGSAKTSFGSSSAFASASVGAETSVEVRAAWSVGMESSSDGSACSVADVTGSLPGATSTIASTSSESGESASWPFTGVPATSTVVRVAESQKRFVTVAVRLRFLITDHSLIEGVNF